MPEGCVVIQRDLNRLEDWADGNVMKLNKGKYKVLHQDNLMHKYRSFPSCVHSLIQSCTQGKLLILFRCMLLFLKLLQFDSCL